MDWAIDIVFTASLAMALFHAVPISIGKLLICILGVVLFLTLWRFHTSQVAQLVRIGHSGLFIHTRSQSYVIPREQITKIRQVGPFFTVSAKPGWFVTLIDKKEPATEKLLEYKRELPIINQTIL